MAGVAALVHHHGVPVAATAIHTMLDRVAFRGPDGLGVWANDEAGLGHAATWRRSVDVDVAEPLVTDQFAVSADCRLDNRAELLETLGRDRTGRERSDTSLIAVAYQRWQERFVDHLLGDFAIVIWDRERRQLVFARDAMGMRPLYFRHEPARRTIVATEVTQILSQLDGDLQPDHDAMVDHLLEREMSLQRSFVAGIDQVAPGELIVARATGEVRRHRFWEPDVHRSIRLAGTTEYAEQLGDLLVEAVAARSDGLKPTALMLSGGVDSVSIAAAGGPGRLHTYSWSSTAFPGVDERAISTRVTDRLKLPATAVSIDDALPLSGWPERGPFVDDAYHGVFTEALLAILDVAAADGMGVVMSGDRGDLMTSGWVLRYPTLLRAGRLGELRAEIGEQRRETGVGLPTIVARDLLLASSRVIKRRFQRSQPHPSVTPHRLRPVERRGPPPPSAATYSQANRLELINATSVTRNIGWTDQLHARVGLGFADPWSDRRIAEFVLAIPQHQLVRPGEIDRKRLARAAIAPMLGTELSNAPSKAAPGAVFAAGLGRAADVLTTLFTGSRCAALGLVDDQAIRAALRSTGPGRPVPRGLWPAISLELWLRTHWA